MISKLILHWAVSTFGDLALNPRERALRMLEEACELAQACDLTEVDCQNIAKRTWSREKDTVLKEMGGLMVTVHALAAVHHIDVDTALEAEVTRVLSKPRDHWRAKHDAKVAAGTTGSVST
jgi:NTP pyrophosphatase (non-canonical NTP hydrolase)